MRGFLGLGRVKESYRGNAGVLVDENNKPSWPLKLPTENDDAAFDRCEARIEDCSGVDEAKVENGRNNAEILAGCNALGAFAISHPGIVQRMQEQVKVALL